MKFRIKGTEQVLSFRATIDGELVLRPDGEEEWTYIDTYFEDHEVPELEYSLDGINWQTIKK